MSEAGLFCNSTGHKIVASPAECALAVPHIKSVYHEIDETITRGHSGDFPQGCYVYIESSSNKFGIWWNINRDISSDNLYRQLCKKNGTKLKLYFARKKHIDSR